MQITETCEVSYIKRGLYYVKLTKNAQCEGCKVCTFGRKDHLVLPAQSQVECKAGDTVSVVMPEESVKGSYIYLYIIPLITMFAGLMAFYLLGEWFMLLGCLLGLTVGFAAVYLIERIFRRRKKYLPMIVSIISCEKEQVND